VLTTVCGIGALVLVWLLYPKPFDYPGAVKDSLTFLQASRRLVICRSSKLLRCRSPAWPS